MASLLLPILALPWLYPLYNLYRFLYVNFIHTSSIQSYLYGPRPYALITGASDGIGKCLAAELFERGFNLVIHGRNKAKLEKVREEFLQRTVSGKSQDIRIIVADAGSVECDFAKIEKELEGLAITVAIHNVGGSAMGTATINHIPPSEVSQLLHMNALFPFRLNQILLPLMRPLPGPALVIFIGSIAGTIPPPYMSPYSASKAFLYATARACDMDERAIKSNVRFMYYDTGGVVSSNGVVTKVEWHTPTAEVYAKAAIQKVGCGQRVVSPYVWHGVMLWAVQLFGERVAEAVMIEGSKRTNGKRREE